MWTVISMRLEIVHVYARSRRSLTCRLEFPLLNLARQVIDRRAPAIPSICRGFTFMRARIMPDLSVPISNLVESNAVALP